MNNGYGYGYSPMQNPNYQARINALQQPMQPSYPQYQPSYQQVPQSYIQNYTQPSGIKGRPVTSIDEAKAAQIDLDGTMTYFPSLAENKIYVKSIGFDGLPIFNVYQLVDTKQSQPVYAESSIVIALQQRVDALERIIKGVNSNVQPNANAANGGSITTE